MTGTYELQLADTSDMVEMHRVFRKALSRAGTLIGLATERTTPEVVASYYYNVLRLLHAHHDGEDAGLTPRLVDRNPDRSELISSIASQHRDVLVHLEAAERTLTEWQLSTSDAAAAELIGALAKLEGALTAHLDAEEQQILPIAAGCMTVAEWGELPAHGLQRFDGDKLWLVLGLIRAQLSPFNLAEMDAHLPPPLQEMWSGSGKRLYQRFMTKLES